MFPKPRIRPDDYRLECRIVASFRKMMISEEVTKRDSVCKVRSGLSQFSLSFEVNDLHTVIRLRMVEGRSFG